MKMLDKVIKAYEICLNINETSCHDCPYTEFDAEGKWACSLCGDCTEDALYYLKELRHILDNTVWVGSTKEEKGYWKLPTLPETGNDPLTWDELLLMEGKPVWVEQQHGDTKGWLLILRKCDDVVTCTTKYGNNFHLYKSLYGEKWKAYKKEQFNTEYEDIPIEYFENGGI